MTTNSNAVNIGVVGEDGTSFLEYKARVQVVGVALLFVYITNYIMQGYVAFVKTDQGKQPVLKKLLETSQLLFWFGVATMFSIVPPFFYGAFNGVMSFLTLLIVIIWHFSCFTSRKIKNRSLWSLMHFFYHLFIFIWIIIGLILSYMWSERVYE